MKGTDGEDVEHSKVTLKKAEMSLDDHNWLLDLHCALPLSLPPSLRVYICVLGR